MKRKAEEVNQINLFKEELSKITRDSIKYCLSNDYCFKSETMTITKCVHDRPFEGKDLKDVKRIPD